MIKITTYIIAKGYVKSQYQQPPNTTSSGMQKQECKFERGLLEKLMKWDHISFMNFTLTKKKFISVVTFLGRKEHLLFNFFKFSLVVEFCTLLLVLHLVFFFALMMIILSSSGIICASKHKNKLFLSSFLSNSSQSRLLFYYFGQINVLYLYHSACNRTH